MKGYRIVVIVADLFCPLLKFGPRPFKTVIRMPQRALRHALHPRDLLLVESGLAEAVEHRLPARADRLALRVAHAAQGLGVLAPRVLAQRGVDLPDAPVRPVDLALVLVEGAVQLRAVVDGAPVVLFAIDSTGTFTVSEGAGLAVLGLEPGEVVGLPVAGVYEGAPQVVKLVEDALATDQELRQRSPVVPSGCHVGEFGGAQEPLASPEDEVGDLPGERGGPQQLAKWLWPALCRAFPVCCDLFSGFGAGTASTAIRYGPTGTTWRHWLSE